VAGAEDALGDALVAALSSWPRDGVPEKPEGWLLTAARHRLIDQARQARVRAEHADTVRLLLSETPSAREPDELPDRRLPLLFVCAHPALDPSVHTPLMLQTVLGLDAARIAQAFLVSPATMAQRLVRAKRKIRDAGIPFEAPAESELGDRLEAVIEAVYSAFGIGWDDEAGAESRGRDLADEAIWLARVLRDLRPDDPEIRGLLALMLFCQARRAARRDAEGRYVPLSEQDPASWAQPALVEAERELSAAAQHGRPGRFQLEAAIQSVHADRRVTGRTEWEAIATFYAALVALAPTLGARIGQAAAIAEVEGPQAGLARLDTLEPAAVRTHQPYWALRGHLLGRLGRRDEAAVALDRAIGLSEDDAVRRFLLERKA
jgi:RNA polymerase sigma-70 factor (ECF subfamily)